MPNMTVNQQRDREDDYKYQGAAGSPNYDQAYHQQQARAESVYTANAALPRGRSETEADQRLSYDRDAHLTSPRLRGGFDRVEDHRPLLGHRRPTVEDDVDVFGNRQVPRRTPEHDHARPEMQRRRQDPQGHPHRDVSVHFEKPARIPLDGRNDQRRAEQERDEREDREYQERVRCRALPAETRRELEMLDELDRLKAEGPTRYRYDRDGRLQSREKQEWLQLQDEQMWLRRWEQSQLRQQEQKWMQRQEEKRRVQRMEEQRRLRRREEQEESDSSSSSDSDDEDRRHPHQAPKQPFKPEPVQHVQHKPSFKKGLVLQCCDSLTVRCPADKEWHRSCSRCSHRPCRSCPIGAGLWDLTYFTDVRGRVTWP